MQGRRTLVVWCADGGPTGSVATSRGAPPMSALSVKLCTVSRKADKSYICRLMAFIFDAQV